MTARVSGSFSIYFSLIKGPLSLMNGCTAFLGYSAGLYWRGGVSFRTDFVVGALIFWVIFFLCGGAAALNNYQDRHIDSRVRRTCYRPLPLKLISPNLVLAISLFQIVFSIAALAAVSGSLSATLTAFTAVFLYNGLYTPLKKRSLFALLPGLLSGALPPIIGWTAAGVPVSAPIFLYIAAALILWQIPHYWLLLLSDDSDTASRLLPSFYYYFTRKKLADLTFTWMVSFSLVILLIPLFLVRGFDSLFSLATLLTIVVGYASALVAVSFYFLKNGRMATGERGTFLSFNLLSLVFSLLLSGYFFADIYLL